jgi:hypothetical protein
VQVGYNNTGQFWWAQNSYGTAFADQGVFKIFYGVGLAANPNETFSIQCRLALSQPVNVAQKWPLQVVPDSASPESPCFWYIAKRGDYVAGIAEHFGSNIVQLVKDNMHVFALTKLCKPDLTTPLMGKRLLVCGITKDLRDTASLGKASIAGRPRQLATPEHASCSSSQHSSFLVTNLCHIESPNRLS